MSGTAWHANDVKARPRIRFIATRDRYEMEIDHQRLTEEYTRRVLHHRDENAVLDAGATDAIRHKNVFRDYMSKRVLKRFLRPRLSDVVVDFGCGVGRLSRFVAPHVREVLALDRVEPMVATALKLTQPAAFPNIRYAVYDGDALPYTDNAATAFFSFWVLNHLSDRNVLRVLNEARRVVRGGGRICLFELVKKQPQMINGIHFLRTVAQYKFLIKSAGLSIVSDTDVMRMPSYALDLWSRFPRLPKRVALPLLARIETATLHRKPQGIDYTTHAFLIENR